MGSLAQGTVDPGFEAVVDAFEANFAERNEIGAACAVYVDGRKVVDVWGGLADAEAGEPWTDHTLVLVFSSTKGAAAVCANLLAQRGQLDMDAPVATYWPEFAAEGKGDITVRQLLSHQAGLPVIDDVLTFEDVLAWDPVVEALARQKPVWEPGTAHGYHATTFGWLVGELIRRVDGRSIGRFFADEVAAPLGLHFTIGTPPDTHDRVARLHGQGHGSGSEDSGGASTEGLDPAIRALAEEFMGPDTLTGRAMSTPNGVLAEGRGYNRPELWEAEIPASNGITDARSLARMYASLVSEVDGVRTLSDEQVAAAATRQIRGRDQILHIKSRFGLGFMLSSVFAPYGGEASFGHAGMGGSVGFADPEHRIGFGYVMNRLDMNFNGDDRTRGLIKATYEAIGVEPAYV